PTPDSRRPRPRPGGDRPQPLRAVAGESGRALSLRGESGPQGCNPGTAADQQQSAPDLSSSQAADARIHDSEGLRANAPSLSRLDAGQEQKIRRRPVFVEPTGCGSSTIAARLRGVRPVSWLGPDDLDELSLRRNSP